MGLVKDSLEGVGKRDYVIAGVLTALGLALMYLNVAEYDAEEYKRNSAIYYGGVVPYAFAIPLFLLVTVPLLWRRVAPIEAMEVAFAGLVINEMLVGTDVLRCGVVFPTAFLFAFTAGAQLQGRESRNGLALSLGLILLSGAVVSAVLGVLIVHGFPRLVMD